jgi:predicted small lipoprotein YifL
MMRWVLLVSLLALSACGVEGPPAAVPGGVTVSGDARIGVVGGL